MDLSNSRSLLRDLTFSPPPPHSFHHTNSSLTSFPILAVAVIGILATALLLVSYYVFVIKCCLNFHQVDIFRRFSLSRRRHNNQDPLMVYAPELRNRGLDESIIRAIPIFKFKKREDEKSSQECSVCLNEFQEDEKLRIIPNCCHLFHIDCIDVWLQNNPNCPLCRARVSSCTSFYPDPVDAPSTSPGLESDTVMVRGDDEYVVIELGSERYSQRNGRLLVEQERSNSGHLVVETSQNRKIQKVMSVGDECIDIRRDKDKQFGTIQPIRRSISMDSSADRQLYLAVQEAIFLRKNQEASVMVGDGGGCSSSSSGNVSNNNRVKRSFFSFGSSRRFRSSSILPLSFEP